MPGTQTLVSTDPQEVVDRVLNPPQVNETPTFGDAEGDESETAAGQAPVTESKEKTDEGEGGFSKRIKKLTKRVYETERERDELRAKVEQLEKGRTTQPEKKDSSAIDPFAYPVPKPKASDFPNPQDFVEALTDWKADEREYRTTKRAEADAQRDVQVQVFDDYNRRVAEAEGEIEDFREVVGGADIKIWPEVRDALLVHDKGPDIVYYLAKHPNEAEKLAEMHPMQAVAEIGRIAASLKAPSSPTSKPRPRTINPVGGTTKATVNGGDLSFADYKKKRERERASR